MTTQNGIDRNFAATQKDSRYTDAQRRHIDGVLNFLVPGFTANIAPRELVGTDAKLEAAVAMVPLLAISARTRTTEVLANADGETFDRAIVYDAQLDEVREIWKYDFERLGENIPHKVAWYACSDEQATYMARSFNFLAPEITCYLTLADVADYDETISAIVAFVPTLIQAAKNASREPLLTFTGARLQRVREYWRDLLGYQKSWRTKFEGLGDTGRTQQVVDLTNLEPAPKAEVSTPIAAPATPAPAPQKKASPATPPRAPKTPTAPAKDKPLATKGLAGLGTLRGSLPEGPAADSELPLAPPAATSVDASALQ